MFGGCSQYTQIRKVRKQQKYREIKWGRVERREEKERRRDRNKLTNEGQPEEIYKRIAVAHFRTFPRIGSAFAFRQWRKASFICSL